MKYLSAVLAAVLMMTAIVSCSGGGKNGEKTNEEKIVGIWNFKELILDGEVAGGINVSLTVTFNSDKSWSAEYEGSYPILQFPSGNYAVSGTDLTLYFENDKGVESQYAWKIEELTGNSARFAWPDHYQYTTLENEELILVFEK